jgi:tripartite-type tricarboxylate transporter receptor subunit TctC
MRRWAAAAVFMLLAMALPALAQDYPSRPITLIVPFPAGGGVDAIARIVANKMSQALGQPIVIDNRGGAGGVIGMRLAARAAPDGYTLVMAHTGITGINPTLYANPGYDPRKDFAPIGLISSTPIVIMAHPSFGPKTIGEMIAYAKANPGKLNIGTPTMGTGGYLSAELFKSMAAVNVSIVLYKGTGPLTNDLLGGQVPVAFNVLAPAMGNLQAGTLRAIAVLGPQRTSLLPNVPTANESGMPGFEAMLHYGWLAPVGTPAPIIARLNAELRKAIVSDDVKARIHADGGDELVSTPEEYAADMAKEAATWSPLIKKLGLKVE